MTVAHFLQLGNAWYHAHYCYKSERSPMLPDLSHACDSFRLAL